MKLIKQMLSLIIALTLLVGTIPMTAITASATGEGETYESIQLDEEKNVTLSSGNSSFYSFTPEEEGYYTFYSYNNDYDTYGYILNSDMETLAEDDESGEANNFKIKYYLEAGTKYILKSRFYGDEEGSFNVSISKLTTATSVEIIHVEDIKMYEGGNHRLSAKLYPENAIDETFTWETDDETVATVSQDGIVTAVAEGDVTITVTTENGLTDTVNVTVYSPKEIGLAEKKAGTISPDFQDDIFVFSPQEDGKYKIIIECQEVIHTSVKDSEGEWINSSGGSWYSFNVDLLSGKTYDIITFTPEEVGSADYNIIIEKLVPATAISIGNYEERNYYTDEECFLHIAFNPENAIEEKITWQTSNPEVATIEYYNYGGGQPDEDTFVNINFVSAGTVTITATSENGLCDSAEFTVVNRPTATEIEITNGENLSGFIAITKQLWVESYPYGSLVQNLTWESSDETVATVDENGEVTFLKTGTVSITVSSPEGLSDTCTVTVKEPEVLTIENPVLVTMTNNEIQYLKFTPYESGVLRFYFTEISNDNEPKLDIFDSSMNWLTGENDDEFLEYVYEAGKTYYISTDFGYYYGDGSGTYYINMAKPVAATAISLDVGTEYKGYIGDEKRLQVVYDPIYAFKETIAWASSDDDIVSVDEEGNICLKAVGTATITATSENGLEATCDVTVEDFEKIELAEEKNVTLSSGNSSFYYFTPEEDGYYTFYSYNNDYDTYGYILNSDMETLAEDDDSGEASNFKIKYYLEAGTKYILKSRFYGDEEGSFNVSIKNLNAVTKLELISMPKKSEYFEGVEPYDINYDGLKLKVTWSDNSETEWEFNYDNAWYIEDSHIELDYTNYHENGEVDLICDEASVTLTFTFTQNPVDHIELVSKGTRTTYFENYDGYIDSIGDSEFFYYYTRFPWDAKIKIVYKNGRTVISNIDRAVDGYEIDWNDNQYNTPWVEGTNNKSTISYLGHTVNLPITVKKNNVDHIELVSAGDRATYFENYGGYMDVNHNGEFFYYNVNEPWDAVIKIVYKDGKSVTTKFEDAVEGYQIEWEHNQYDTPWVLGTNNKATISYLGHTVSLPITVKKNNVKSIQVVSGKVTCIENTYGEQWEDSYYYYYDIPSNITMKINYTDGTSKTVNIHDTVDGQYFDCNSDQEFKPWVLGDNNSLTVSYLDVTTKLPVSIIKNPVDRIELITAPTRKYIYGDQEFGYTYQDGTYGFYPTDLTGLSFKVYYKNGTIKTFTYNDIGINDMVNGYRVELHYDYYNPQIGKHAVTLYYIGKTADYTVELLEAGHVHTKDAGTVTKKATCTAEGAKLYKCTSCKSSLDTEILPKIAHNYITTTTKATLSKNGSIVKKCSCGKVASTTTIKYVKTIKLSTTSYTYNGKTKKPTVTVKDSSGKTLKKDTDYTVSFSSGLKSVGTYKVTIKMKGNYTGTKTLSFKINPPKTGVKKLTAGKKSLKVSINKKTTQVTGYEIQYSTSKKFKSAKKVTIKKAKTTTTTIKKLKAKKTYYVRVRTYKTVKGKKYYSDWSSYKSKKTK